jgi:hypothetical protein
LRNFFAAAALLHSTTEGRYLFDKTALAMNVIECQFVEKYF